MMFKVFQFETIVIVNGLPERNGNSFALSKNFFILHFDFSKDHEFPKSHEVSWGVFTASKGSGGETGNTLQQSFLGDNY